MAVHDYSKTSFDYLSPFYNRADGHPLNKFHLALSGPYVDEAMKVMDLNSAVDKYNTDSPKLFKGKSVQHERFVEWARLHYLVGGNPSNKYDNGVLHMLWNAKKVEVGLAKARVEDKLGLDTVKNMVYPLITSYNTGGNKLTITVQDDEEMMWWQFFNALFNVQFTPLILKPRSTYHKINVAVDVLGGRTAELTSTHTESHLVTTDRREQRTVQTSVQEKINVTDLDVMEYMEFNSSVLSASPDLNPDSASYAAFTFRVEFRYPNAFQGTFKKTDRGLRDETSQISGASSNSVAIDEHAILDISKGGLDYQRGFFEDPGYAIESTALAKKATYAAHQPKVYTAWKSAQR